MRGPEEACIPENTFGYQSRLRESKTMNRSISSEALLDRRFPSLITQSTIHLVNVLSNLPKYSTRIERAVHLATLLYCPDLPQTNPLHVHADYEGVGTKGLSNIISALEGIMIH